MEGVATTSHLSPRRLALDALAPLISLTTLVLITILITFSHRLPILGSLGVADSQRAPLSFDAVQLLDRAVGVLSGVHVDEAVVVVTRLLGFGGVWRDDLGHGRDLKSLAVEDLLDELLAGGVRLDGWQVTNVQTETLRLCVCGVGGPVGTVPAIVAGRVVVVTA